MIGKIYKIDFPIEIGVCADQDLELIDSMVTKQIHSILFFFEDKMNQIYLHSRSCRRSA